MEIDPFKDNRLKSYQKIPPFKKFKKVFRKFDIYAMPIALRYKGEKKFYTNAGAFVSLFLIISMLFLTTVQILAINDDSGQDVSLTFADEFSQDRTTLTGNPGTDAPFLFGFNIVDDSGNTFDYTNYLQIELNTVYNIYNEVADSYTQLTTTYGLTNCQEMIYDSDLTSELNFQLTKDQFNRAGFGDYQCPNQTLGNYFVGNMPYDDQFNETYLKFWACGVNSDLSTDGVTCESLSDIATQIQNLQIKFFYLDTFFKPNNLSQPLAAFVNNQLSNGLIPSSATIVDLMMKRNQGYRQDSPYDSSYNVLDPQNFFQSQSVTTQTYYNPSYTYPILTYRFQEYQLYTQYTRSTVKILDVLVDTGGTWSGLNLIGASLTTVISYELYMSSLINRLFYFDAKFDSEREKPKNEAKKGNDGDGNDGKGKGKNKTADNDPEAQLLNANEGPEKVEKLDDDENEDEQDNAAMQALKAQYAAEEAARQSGKQALMDSIQQGLGMNKAKYTYRTGEIIRKFAFCRILRTRAQLRQKEEWRQLLYYSKGLEALDREVDIGYILDQLRITRQFLKTTLNKDQRVLLKLQDRVKVNSGDEKPNYLEFSKTINKDLLLERYVDVLQSKVMSKQDVRLLQITGNHEAVRLLNEMKEKELRKKKEGGKAEEIFKIKNQERAQTDWEKKSLWQLKQQEMLSALNKSSSSEDDDFGANAYTRQDSSDKKQKTKKRSSTGSEGELKNQKNLLKEPSSGLPQLNKNKKSVHFQQQDDQTSDMKLESDNLETPLVNKKKLKKASSLLLDQEANQKGLLSSQGNSPELIEEISPKAQQKLLLGNGTEPPQNTGRSRQKGQVQNQPIKKPKVYD